MDFIIVFIPVPVVEPVHEVDLVVGDELIRVVNVEFNQCFHVEELDDEKVFDDKIELDDDDDDDVNEDDVDEDDVDNNDEDDDDELVGSTTVRGNGFGAG